VLESFEVYGAKYKKDDYITEADSMFMDSGDADKINNAMVEYDLVLPESVIDDVVVLEGSEKFKCKLSKAFWNTIGFVISGYGLEGWLRYLAIAGNIAIVADIGYGLITKKPELAEFIYNKAFGKKCAQK
jgi:hypothetical protein